MLPADASEIVSLEPSKDTPVCPYNQIDDDGILRLCM